MAVKTTFELDADVKGAVAGLEEVSKAAGEATKKVEDTDKAIKKTNQDAQREAKESAQALDKVGNGAIRGLDQATGGLIGKFKGLYTDIKKVNLGFKGMKAAIAATGIGLLLVALGEIAANWDSIVGYLGKASKESEKLLESTTKNAEAQQAGLDAISEQENILKRQGKTEKEIRDLKIQQTKETITALEAQLLAQKTIKKEQVEQAERNKAILQGIIRALTAPLSILLNVVDMVGDAIGQDFGLDEKFTGGIANMVFNPEEVAKAGDETIAETEKQLLKLKNSQAGLENQSIKESEDRAAKARQDRFDQMNKEQQDAQRALEDHLANMERIRKEADDRRIANRIAIADYEHDLLMEEFNESVRILEERKKKGKEASDAALKEATDRYNAFKQGQDLIVGSLLDSVSAISEINSMFDEENEAQAKQRFENNKLLQYANTVINTASGIVSALTVNPGDVLTGANYIKAASIAAAGLAQLSTISKTQFKSKSAPSPTSPNGPRIAGSGAAAQANFNLVGTSGVNQIVESINSQNQRPVQAYVVGGQISSQQELDRKRIKTATFG